MPFLILSHQIINRYLFQKIQWFILLTANRAFLFRESINLIYQRFRKSFLNFNSKIWDLGMCDVFCNFGPSFGGLVFFIILHTITFDNFSIRWALAGVFIPFLSFHFPLSVFFQFKHKLKFIFIVI